MSFALKCVCYLQPLFSWMDFIKPAKGDHKPFLWSYHSAEAATWIWHMWFSDHLELWLALSPFDVLLARKLKRITETSNAGWVQPTHPPWTVSNNGQDPRGSTGCQWQEDNTDAVTCLRTLALLRVTSVTKGRLLCVVLNHVPSQKCGKFQTRLILCNIGSFLLAC